MSQGKQPDTKSTDAAFSSDVSGVISAHLLTRSSAARRFAAGRFYFASVFAELL